MSRRMRERQAAVDAKHGLLPWTSDEAGQDDDYDDAEDQYELAGTEQQPGNWRANALEEPWPWPTNHSLKSF